MAKYFFTEPVPMQVILRDGRVYEERAYCPTDARLAVAAHGEAGWEDVMDAKVAISTEAMRAAGYLPKPSKTKSREPRRRLPGGCCAQRRRDAGPSGTAERLTETYTGSVVGY